MADAAFYFILNMSLAASLVIVTLLLVRLIRPLPRRMIYPLWALVFLRLVFPFALSTNWSLFNWTGGLIKRLITIETITQGKIDLPLPANWATMNFIGAAESFAPIQYRTESLRQIFTAGAAVWLIGTITTILIAVILYALTRTELRKAVLVRDNIYRSDMLLSPVLMGIIHPRIILPKSLDVDSTEAQMVLAHENVHRRRLDNLWRVLAILIACVHWFNPLVWIMLKAFLTDMEQSCDESVLRTGHFDPDDRKAYARALLRFAESNRVYVSSAFGQSGVKVRIISVLNYQRMTIIGTIISALFLLAVVLALITNPSLGR